MTQLYKLQSDGTALAYRSNEIPSEAALEDIIQRNPELVFGQPILIIGRQVVTQTMKRLDLLGIDIAGRLVMLELKRGVAPREIIAQVLDYSSWAIDLSEREIEKLAKTYFEDTACKSTALIQRYREVFNREPPGSFGGEVVSVLIATEFTDGVRKPAQYLNDQGVPISCVSYELFRDDSGSQVIATRLEVGEFLDFGTESRATEAHLSLAETKQICRQLTEFLEEMAGEWSDSIGAEKFAPFRTYQERSGHWTCSYIDWVHPDGGRVVLEFGLDLNEPGITRFATYIWARKRCAAFTDAVTNDQVVTNFLNDFENESESASKPAFSKYIVISDGELNFAKVQQLAILEFDAIRPIVERIVSGSAKSA